MFTFCSIFNLIFNGVKHKNTCSKDKVTGSVSESQMSHIWRINNCVIFNDFCVWMWTFLKWKTIHGIICAMVLQCGSFFICSSFVYYECKNWSASFVYVQRVKQCLCQTAPLPGMCQSLITPPSSSWNTVNVFPCSLPFRSAVWRWV